MLSYLPEQDVFLRFRAIHHGRFLPSLVSIATDCAGLLWRERRHNGLCWSLPSRWTSFSASMFPESVFIGSGLILDDHNLQTEVVISVRMDNCYEAKWCNFWNMYWLIFGHIFFRTLRLQVKSTQVWRQKCTLFGIDTSSYFVPISLALSDTTTRNYSYREFPEEHFQYMWWVSWVRIIGT